MKILNLHGFRGEQHNFAYKALTELGHSVVSPNTDYDTEIPDEIVAKLRSIIDHEVPELIVGMSLGGFYAAILSAQTQLPAILLNPCLMPFYHLPLLGYEGDIEPYIRLFGEISELDISKVQCLIGGKDEVIDTHSFDIKLFGKERVTIAPEGLHSGATLPLKDYFSKMIK